MHILLLAMLSILLLLTTGIQFAVSSDVSSSSPAHFSTTTITSTMGFTHTMTRTITAYGPPTTFSYQSITATTSLSLPTSISLPTITSSTISFLITPATNPNTNTQQPAQAIPKPQTQSPGKLIGLLFAGGVVLALFACVVLVIGRKQYKKAQNKRIREWVDSTGHGRWEGSGVGAGGVEGGFEGAGGKGIVGEMGVQKRQMVSGEGVCKDALKIKRKEIGRALPTDEIRFPEASVWRGIII